MPKDEILSKVSGIIRETFSVDDIEVTNETVCRRFRAEHDR